jgi:subtilisin
MKRCLIMCITLVTFGLMIRSQAIASVEVSQGVIPEHYIVVLKDDVPKTVPDVANEMAQAHGLALGHLYKHALRGFSARIPDKRLEILRKDPRVRRIDADRIIYAMPKKSPKGHPPSEDTPPPPQQLTSGVDRIDADLNNTPRPIDVDIAVIDTGIDLDHPDLNVVADVSFISGKNSGDDDNGHGSHVGCIAAAKDDAYGVVGVAPGARLWAVKVLDRSGRGTWAGVIAGIDYVTAHATEIEVANMSLGGSGSDTESALRIAIENSVAAGVTYVVAAGNSAKDAENFVPAAYDAVMTVSAVADSDGQEGGLGPDTSYGGDDTFASFSNFGADVIISAPGVDIYSCWKKGGYKTISGTSMSSPHVAGAAALFISKLPGVSPSDVANALVTSGEYGGFSGDPDIYPEPIVDASNL